MREDLDKLLSPKRKRSTRSTSSKKNSVSHQPNSTQSLDNITSPISSPVGSQKSNYFFGGDSNGDASYETRGSASCTEDNQQHLTRSSTKNMSKITSVSTTPPSSSSSGCKSRLSLLSMVYQSAGKGRTPCETTQIISPSPESSPDRLKELITRKCDFEDLVSECVVEPLCCGWNSHPLDRINGFKDQTFSSKENFENDVTLLGPSESNFVRRHHSFTCPGSENLRPQVDDYFSSLEGESDDEMKSSATTYQSRNSSKSKFVCSILPGSRNRNSDDDRQLHLEREGIDCEGRLSALHMGVGLGKRKSTSRSLFCVNDDEDYNESKMSSVTEDSSSKFEAYHRDYVDEKVNMADSDAAAYAHEDVRNPRLGSILERDGGNSDPPSPFYEVSSSSGRNNIINVNSDNNNGVPERFIGRVGASLVVRGNPFSSSVCSSPPAYAYRTSSSDERKNVPSVTVGMGADFALCWELTAPYNSTSTDTVRFPYSTYHFPIRTPSKSAAEHMGDLGTPVTEAGSPADIDMDGDVAADVSVTRHERSFLTRVRDNEIEEILSARKNRKERSDNGALSHSLDIGHRADTASARGSRRNGGAGSCAGDDLEDDIRRAMDPTGYTVYRPYSDSVPPCEEESTSNISHITADSTGELYQRPHNVSFRVSSIDRDRGKERETEKKKEVEVRRSRRHGISESANSLDQLDGLYHSSLGECSLSFSSSFTDDNSGYHPHPRTYVPHQHHHHHRSSSGGSHLSAPRPLPDQTAFDGRFPTAKATSPTLIQATPSRVLCPATPMRTPSWAVDRLPEDSDDQRSVKSSSSGSAAPSMSMSTRRDRAPDRGLSLKQNRVLISLSDSISTADVSFDRDFYHEGLLGVGTSADVYKAREKDGQLYAVKKIKNPFRSKRDRNVLMGEVTTMKKLGEVPCKNIVRLIRAWQEDGHFFVQVDLAERGTLRDLLTVSAMNSIALKESTVWHIVHDAAAGLQHIHNCGFVHLDVKPANLLISLDGCLKIGDFGLTVESGKQWDGREGDNGYMAPELLINDYRYPTADVFSLGLTLYEVCVFLEYREAVSSGQSALPAGGDEWHLLRRGQAPKIPSQYSESLMTVIESAMARKPANRPTTQHLLGLPEVVLAGATGDPVLESAKGMLSTGMGAEMGPGSGPGTGSEFQGRLHFSRSASFNPTMAQLLGFSIGTGIGSGIGSDLMISPQMGGVNGSLNKGFHFSEDDLERDRSRESCMDDTDSMDRADPTCCDAVDVTNGECSSEGGTGHWGDLGPEGAETSECAHPPKGAFGLYETLHCRSQCSRSLSEGGEKECDEMSGKGVKNKNMGWNRDSHRDRERGKGKDKTKGRERIRVDDDVLHLMSNETISTSSESFYEDEDNLIGSETFF